MYKPKSTFYLPAKVIDALDKEAEKGGYVREKVVAASLMAFLNSSVDARSRMFDRLDSFLENKKSQGC